MRAVAYRHARPVNAEDALVDVEIDRPEPGANDLLVKVEAVSVNPVDTKVRRGNDPGGEAKVLGFDAAGTVAAVGGAVTLFKPGDAVWYAGSVARPGSNAEFHAVDERIVGPKPAGLGFAESARAAADRAHRVGAPLRPHRGRAGEPTAARCSSSAGRAASARSPSSSPACSPA